MQLNVFHRDVAAITEDELQGDKLSRLCGMIKLGVQEHTGITEGTFFRDQGWCFYELGRLIERADQTTRLLDIRYHSLVPPGTEERRVDEMTLWAGVLRAAAGYHAFRRVAPPGFTPQDVVRVPADRHLVPAQRAAVRRRDGVAAGAVAQPVWLARHRCGAGTHRGSARRHPVAPGGTGDRGRLARIPRWRAA